MPLNIIRNDITKMEVDVIVNAANTDLVMGGGVCGAIFSAAGAGKLQDACDRLAPIKTGDAIITEGFDLAAKYIIHTAGPVYRDGKHDEEALLCACYANSLELALKHGCESIAFPLISSGIYGYPKDEALEVATSTISKWLMDNDMDVSLVVFDKKAFELSNELLGDVKAFIDENYVDESNLQFGRSSTVYEKVTVLHGRAINISHDEPEDAEYFMQMPESITELDSLTTVEKESKDFDWELDEPFSVTLLRLIDAKGKTDVEIYKRANLDRKLFSKIRTGKNYMPSKKTAIALAIALELSLSETHDLLERAGFALSRSVMFDVIIEYFITRKKYNIFEINNVLFEYDQALLGS